MTIKITSAIIEFRDRSKEKVSFAPADGKEFFLIDYQSLTIVLIEGKSRVIYPRDVIHSLEVEYYD